MGGRDAGSLGGVIVLLLWFYLSGIAILLGAELNAEIEHASPYGKDPGEKVPGQKKKLGAAVRRDSEERQRQGGGQAKSSVPQPVRARPGYALGAVVYLVSRIFVRKKVGG